MLSSKYAVAKSLQPCKITDIVLEMPQEHSKGQRA